MKLLVDMNLSPRWVDMLTDAGIQAVHWTVVGAKNASDAEIMAYALANVDRQLVGAVPFPGGVRGESPV
ncbi:MAG TPA: DUF5615 family PIN-like protein [Burkholderiaceae bacterium]|jgi:predicted nuclease of predicted toxin-antitoxin system|nr:DUF5615 family PIN-like protein [Burkholderiaceae bacterium]